MEEKKYRLVIHKPLEALMIVEPSSSKNEVLVRFNRLIEIARFTYLFLRQEPDRVMAFDEDDDCESIYMIVDTLQFPSIPKDKGETVKEIPLVTINLFSLGIGIVTDIGDLLSDIGASYLREQSKLEDEN